MICDLNLGFFFSLILTCLLWLETWLVISWTCPRFCIHKCNTDLTSHSTCIISIITIIKDQYILPISVICDRKLQNIRLWAVRMLPIVPDWPEHRWLIVSGKDLWYLFIVIAVKTAALDQERCSGVMSPSLSPLSSGLTCRVGPLSYTVKGQ